MGRLKKLGQKFIDHVIPGRYAKKAFKSSNSSPAQDFAARVAPTSAPPPPVVPEKPPVSLRSGNALAPEELYREVGNVLARDRGRAATLSYPTYSGPNLPPMSSLTQKARELREQFAQKPAPYSRKLETVLTRPNEGYSPANIQNLLDNLVQRQGVATQGSVINPLQKQFRASYTPERAEAFRAKDRKDVGKGIGALSGKLQNLSQSASNLEGERNNQIVKTLQALQKEKQARREGLIGNLEQFGSQKHALGNKSIAANKALFNQEAQEPQRKMDMLAQALGQYGPNLREDAHPDIAKNDAQQLIQALRAYGIDPSKPVGEWDSTRTSSPRYPGKLIADATPEMEMSYNLLERISPKMKDTYSDERKNIVRGLIGDESVGNKSLRNLYPAMEGETMQLDSDAKARLKKDLAAINNKYIKLGQYGSPQHIGESERRAREISKAMLEQKGKILGDNMKNQLVLQHGKEIGDIKKLNQLGEQGFREFSDVIKDIRDTNKLGATKWRNEQDELEELYKNYQNERLWEWPHMRNAIRGEAHGEIFGKASERGVSLDELAGLKTRYSELEKERDRLKADVNSSRDYYTNRLNEMSKLEEARKAREAAEQQRVAQAQRDQVKSRRKASFDKYLEGVKKYTKLPTIQKYEKDKAEAERNVARLYPVRNTQPYDYDNWLTSLENIRRHLGSYQADLARTIRDAETAFTHYPERWDDYLYQIPVHRDWVARFEPNLLSDYDREFGDIYTKLMTTPR